MERKKRILLRRRQQPKEILGNRKIRLGPRTCTHRRRETALNKVKDSLEYENGRYRVAVPWKDGKPERPDTKPMALSCLRSTERNLKKDNRVAEEYKATIQAYVEKGYLRKVPSDEQLPNNVWYLPHFPVVRMDKATTKVRIVFDCAAKCNGISLKDMIHAGPKLLQGLFNVLVRFRRNPVGIACDIKEMYLQIEVKEQDRSHFRLLWRDLDPNREPDVFEFNRVVLGKNSAPIESQFVAQENARRNQDRYPLAAEAVLKSTYMDDSIDSVENDEEGVELYRELKDYGELPTCKHGNGSLTHRRLWKRFLQRSTLLRL